MFVTFEGPEGAGKSTALQAVAAELRTLGREVTTTREPGGGPLGKRIRQMLLEEDAVSAETELLLFLADRANHVETIIRPALAAGHVVLCDRHADSTLVYQGYGRGLPLDFLRAGNAFATRGLVPDRTLLFDLDPSVGLARLGGREVNRLDQEPLDFHRRVREGFLTLAHEEPSRFVVLDATMPPADLAAAALTAILR
ncbi:MAG: dTMP kinase [Armatimonadetes bacterium]|nr:dTMP kinase [Armatimonadota bacterium]MBS1727144.1 dTMP kinase [Armatimonadota bacterium]